jgi:Amt family ammonium transporter
MPAQLTGSALELCVVLTLLFPLALAGLALMNTGFGRARSAAHAMLSSIAAMAVAAITFCALGFHWTGIAGGASWVAMLRGTPWDWLGRGPVLLHGLAQAGPTTILIVLFQVFAVGFAALIPISAGAERWRLPACCISSALFACITYPLFAHWAWGGGWLGQLGKNFGMGSGFMDFGGAGVVQVVGGLTALAITWILGPRLGRYSPDGMTAAIPGHNIVYVLFGCLLMIPGWIGLNGAGALLFASASSADLPMIALNTVLSAFAATLAAVVATRIRFGKPDASLIANGFVGGLVASSAVAMVVTPTAAIVVGFVTGWLVMVSAETLEVRLSVDDPGGAISAHAVAGCWALFAVGLFAKHAPVRGLLHPGAQDNSGQMAAQIVGIATLIGVVLPLSYGLNWLLNRIYTYRVEPSGEWMGMDLDQLGAGAYPEFSIHRDDSKRF